MLKFIVIMVLLGGIIAYNLFSWGFLITKFWAWFFIPAINHAFPQILINPINVWIGIAFYLMTCFFKEIPKEDDIQNTAKTDSWIIILIPWFILIMGWIIHIVIPI